LVSLRQSVRLCSWINGLIGAGNKKKTEKKGGVLERRENLAVIERKIWDKEGKGREGKEVGTSLLGPSSQNPRSATD